MNTARRLDCRSGSSREVAPSDAPRARTCFLFAAAIFMSVFSLSQTAAAPEPDQTNKPNLSGIWILDLKGSTSVGPLMKQVGASLPERTYAASTKLKATVHQTEQVLTISAQRLSWRRPVKTASRSAVTNAQTTAWWFTTSASGFFPGIPPRCSSLIRFQR